MKVSIQLPAIPEDQKSPLILRLLEIIEQQGSIIQQLAEQNQELRDEIARLKNQKPKPKISPSRLEDPKRKKGKKRKKKRPGSKKKRKTANLQIHETIPIEPEFIPDRSEFKGYSDFVVQGLKIEVHNIRYRRKAYITPDGQYICGKLPAEVDGHFNCELIQFILYQNYHCHVTQPLLLEQLHEIGIDISKGQLNNILVENKDRFHREKDRILAAGIEVSSYINVDDTGARHKGKNGYCTHIGNELFSWFESTESKNRINFLKLLRAGHTDYFLNTEAIAYMQANKLPGYVLGSIQGHLDTSFVHDCEWNRFLEQNDVVKEHHIRIATEGALIGSIVEHGISDNLVIVSDDAGQFNVLLHALCWIHAERTINKIIPLTPRAKEDLATVRESIWQLYDDIKAYKANPNEKDKKSLEKRFDEIFTTQTASATLNAALKRLYKNKSELLLVLERPDIPLHNNGAENPIREYVKKRKISGSTRSESGRKCRDTFTSLKKTCRKLGIPFWQYLKDRVENTGLIPDLADLIRQRAFEPG